MKSSTIIIADSGSTKTDWAIINGEKRTNIRTIGLNPFFVAASDIEKTIKKEIKKTLYRNKPDQIFFYGSGCGNIDNCTIVKNALLSCFPTATIDVNTDILGAARALYGDGSGIAAIIGTGSNCCLFKGNKIIAQYLSLGYFFGDEGSGTHLGKTLLQAILKESAPQEVVDAFHKKYNYSAAVILGKLYREQSPNRFLASFAEFISENIHMEFCSGLVKKCFASFFTEHIFQFEDYKSEPIKCTGSVAFGFRKQLTEVAENFGIKIHTIVQSPVDGLVVYHTKSKS